jgi:hypothetical protein
VVWRARCAGTASTSGAIQLVTVPVREPLFVISRLLVLIMTKKAPGLRNQVGRDDDELGGKTDTCVVVLGLAIRGRECHVALVDVTDALRCNCAHSRETGVDPGSGGKSTKGTLALREQHARCSCSTGPGIGAAVAGACASQRSGRTVGRNSSSRYPSCAMQSRGDSFYVQLENPDSVTHPWFYEQVSLPQELDQYEAYEELGNVATGLSSTLPQDGVRSFCSYATPPPASEPARVARGLDCCGRPTKASSSSTCTIPSSPSTGPLEERPSSESANQRRTQAPTQSDGFLATTGTGQHRKRGNDAIASRVQDTEPHWFESVAGEGTDFLEPVDANFDVDDVDLLVVPYMTASSALLANPLTAVTSSSFGADAHDDLLGGDEAGEPQLGAVAESSANEEYPTRPGVAEISEAPAHASTPRLHMPACRFLAQFTEKALSFSSEQKRQQDATLMERLLQAVEILLLEAYALANIYRTRCRRVSPNRSCTVTTNSSGDGDGGMEPRACCCSRTGSGQAPLHHRDGTMQAYQRRLSDWIRCCLQASDREGSHLGPANDASLDGDWHDTFDAFNLGSVLCQIAQRCGRKSRRRRAIAADYRLAGIGLVIDSLRSSADQRAVAERLEWRFHCPVTVVCWDEVNLPLISVLRPSPLSMLAGSGGTIRGHSAPADPVASRQGIALLLLSSERGCLCRLVADPRMRKDLRVSADIAGGLDIRIGGYGPLLGDEGSPFVLGLDALRYALCALDGMRFECSSEPWDRAACKAAADELLALALTHFACADLETLLHCLYRGPLPRCRMVEFGYLVAEQAGANMRAPTGNRIAQRALYRAGHALGRHLAAAFSQAPLELPVHTPAAGNGNASPQSASEQAMPSIPVICVGRLLQFLRTSEFLAAGLRAGWRETAAARLKGLRLQLLTQRSTTPSQPSASDHVEVLATLLACDRSGIPGSASQALLEQATPNVTLEPMLWLE